MTTTEPSVREPVWVCPECWGRISPAGPLAFAPIDPADGAWCPQCGQGLGWVPLSKMGRKT